tara:strand:- start:485 stop:1009 length:525 start_codon:yes stop_codon:yes gene_type:complete
MSLVRVNQSANKYRLGDAILLDNSARNKIKNFPNTIAHDYLTATGWAPKFFDKDIITRIINEHIKKHNYKAPETEIVLHWRFHPYFELERLDRLKEVIGNREVTVCAALHSNETKSLKEFNEFINQDNVKLQSSLNADEDFCFLFQAKKLIITKGNFGNALYEIRDKNENTFRL